MHEFFFRDHEGRECCLKKNSAHPLITLNGPMRRLEAREAKKLLRAAIQNRDSIGQHLKQAIWLDGYHGTLEQFLENEVGWWGIPRYWVFQSKKPPFRIHPATQPDKQERKDAKPVEPIQTRIRFEIRVVDEVGAPLVGVKTSMVVGGEDHSVSTDSDGKAAVECEDRGSFGRATIQSDQSLEDALEARWKEVRETPHVEYGPDMTFVHLRDLQKPDAPIIRIEKAKTHTIVIRPDVVLIRFIGEFFNTNKAFLVPNAKFPNLRALYETSPDAQVLVVGHTDTSGEPDYNASLSIDRANATIAFLTGDVETWMEFYADTQPIERRWGQSEDEQMLQAVVARKTSETPEDQIRDYQSTRGLQVDGVVGEQTRRALIPEYFALDELKAPTGIAFTPIGAGEAFPLKRDGTLDDAPKDGMSEPENRRVELFFFRDNLAILPEPPGGSLDKTTPEYLEWLRRAHTIHEHLRLLLTLRVVLATLGEEPDTDEDDWFHLTNEDRSVDVIRYAKGAMASDNEHYVLEFESVSSELPLTLRHHIRGAWWSVFEAISAEELLALGIAVPEDVPPSFEPVGVGTIDVDIEFPTDGSSHLIPTIES